MRNHLWDANNRIRKARYRANVKAFVNQSSPEDPYEGDNEYDLRAVDNYGTCNSFLALFVYSIAGSEENNDSNRNEGVDSNQGMVFCV